jgi:pilus assembly protein Flp/PilA
MQNGLRKLLNQLQTLAMQDEGQDLVEYALLIALVAFGAIAGMNSLATGLSTAFTNISTQLGTNIT